MLTRLLCARGFKPYSAWKAEQLGVSESRYLTQKKEFETGAYDAWRDKEIAASRINFVLDHVPSAEQAEYLKEVSTEHLMLYLVNNIDGVDAESLNRLQKIKVKLHTLPVLDGVFGMLEGAFKSAVEKGAGNHAHHQREIVARRILLKMRERALQELDDGVVKSNEVAKA